MINFNFRSIAFLARSVASVVAAAFRTSDDQSFLTSEGIAFLVGSVAVAFRTSDDQAFLTSEGVAFLVTE